MPKILDKLYNGFTKTKGCLVLAVVLAYCGLLVFGGGSVAAFLGFGAALLVYIVLPGLLAVRLLRAESWVKGYLPLLALLLGSGFFAALYCVSMRLGMLWLLRALPPVLALCALLAEARRLKKPAGHRVRHARLQSHQWLLVLLFSALLLLYTFYGVAKNAHPAAVGNMLLNQDLLWNVGNAESFKLAFPPQDIRFVGVRLHYHYLTELLAGALSIVSGISCYDILAFYLQPYMLGAMVLCLFRFGSLVFEKSRFKAMLFTYAMFLFSCASLWKVLPNGLSVFWNANIIHYVTNINSQTTAVIYLCIFTGLFIQAARHRYKMGFLYMAVCLCAFFMLCFAKGPLAALVAIAVVCVLVFGLFTRSTGWRGLVLGLALGGVFVAVYTVLFSSGAADSMAFTPAGTLIKGYFHDIADHLWWETSNLWKVGLPALWVLQSFLMMPAQFPLYVRGAVGDVVRIHRLPPERLLFNAVALGGLAAYFLFDHPAMSQTYFLYGAIFFVTLLAVDGTDRLREWWQAAKKGRWGRRLALGFVAVCAAVGLATTGILYVHMLGSGLRQVLRNVGLEEKYPYALVMTADDEAAMEWLAQNSPQNAMFATNRIHTGYRREGISNLYSALSGRQGFMEGFQYAKTNMGVSNEEITARLGVNTALFGADTPPEEIPQLCRQYGISYLVFCTQMNGVDASDSQMGEMVLVWSSGTVRIYGLPEGPVPRVDIQVKS